MSETATQIMPQCMNIMRTQLHTASELREADEDARPLFILNLHNNNKNPNKVRSSSDIARPIHYT